MINHKMKELGVEKLEAVRLSSEVLSSYPSELSGGMQKHVALTRAICTNPEIIFFSEPTTGLNPIISNVINDLIIKVRNKLGATTITINDDINSALKIANEVALMGNGKIIWSETNSDLFNPKDLSLCQFVNRLTDGPISEIN